MAPPATNKPRPELLLQRREGLLLALVINHPKLLATYLEEVAAVPLLQKQLEQLRGALIDVVAGARDLQAVAIEAQLRRQGLGAVLDQVLAPATYTLFPAARPDASLHVARENLEALLADQAAQDASKELEEAEKRLAADPTEENLARLTAAIRLKHDAEARRGALDTLLYP